MVTGKKEIDKKINAAFVDLINIIIYRVFYTCY